ncbi:MAG TPA: hypothetical protein VFZ34_07350 [Blastocatellia bacterium]|nr:hypothetical protein [Blastocatellia bacterium]
MKRAPFLLLLGLLFSVELLPAQPPASPPPTTTTPTPAPDKDPLDVWQPMTLREGNFSFIFPATAKHEGTRARYQMQDGSALETRFTAPTTGGNYQAAYTFLSENIATPQAIRQRFDVLLNNLKTNPKIKWLSGGEIEYRGNPGIELKVQMTDSKVIVWSRQYFAFGCLYELTARYLSREPELKEPQIFLDSFNLMGPPTQRPALAAPKQELLPDFTPITQTIYYVSPETLRKHAIQPVEPDFDKKALGWNITLRVTVSTEGKVIEAYPIDGLAELYEDAVKAARKWSFKPFLLAGKPVSVQGQLVFKSSGTENSKPK